MLANYYCLFDVAQCNWSIVLFLGSFFHLGFLLMHRSNPFGRQHWIFSQWKPYL